MLKFCEASASQERDGIAIDVAQPPYGGRRLDVEAAGDDMNVVTLARLYHQAVWPEFDRRVVLILRLMDVIPNLQNPKNPLPYDPMKLPTNVHTGD